LAGFALLSGCPKPAGPPAPDTPAAASKVDLSSPEATFETLRAAVAARDLESYERCFAKASAEREGMVGKLRADPEQWSRLDALLRGPQALQIRDAGPTQVSARVEAPEAAGGGIGGLTFVLEADGWVIQFW
jgi:hypothetical protein